MGLLKSIKSTFRKSTKDVEGDGSSTDVEGSKSEGALKTVEIDNRSSERQSSRTTRIPLPAGRIGIKFAGSPPEITKVEDDSPILGKVQEGQIINSVIIPGGKCNTKIDAVAASKLLKDSSDSEGRVLLVRSFVDKPGDNEANNDEPVVTTNGVADNVDQATTNKDVIKVDPKDRDVIVAKVTTEEESEEEANVDDDEEESEVNNEEVEAKQEDDGDNYEPPTDKGKNNVDTEDRPVISADDNDSKADENEEENADENEEENDKMKEQGGEKPQGRHGKSVAVKKHEVETAPAEPSCNLCGIFSY